MKMMMIVVSHNGRYDDLPSSYVLPSGLITILMSFDNDRQVRVLNLPLL